MGFKQVGALWRKRSSKGEEFFSGTVEAAGSLLVFKNKRRHAPKSPDFIVMQSDGSGERFAGNKEKSGSEYWNQEFIAPFAEMPPEFRTRAETPS